MRGVETLPGKRKGDPVTARTTFVVWIGAVRSAPQRSAPPQQQSAREAEDKHQTTKPP